MKYIVEYIKALIISPEVLISAPVMGMIAIFQPQWFDKVGEKIKLEQEVWKYLCLIPAAVLVWLLAHCYSVQLPHASNKVLLKWPDYWKLRITVNVGLFFSALCAATAVFVFAFTKEIYSNVAGAILISAILISLIDGFTIWQASITIRQIVEKYSDKS